MFFGGRLPRAALSESLCPGLIYFVLSGLFGRNFAVLFLANPCFVLYPEASDERVGHSKRD